MKKSFLLILLSCILLTTLCACKSKEKEHIHSYTKTYEYDNISHWQTCDECGYLNKLNHDWGEGTYVVQPTETVEGIMKYTCKVCGATIEENTGVLGHEHTFEKEWTCDESYHWHVSTCEHKNIFKKMSLHEFDDGVVKTAATCQNEGEIVYTCKVCNYQLTKVLPKLDHKEEVINGVEPTFSKTGLTAGVRCSECLAILVAQEEIESLNRTYICDSKYYDKETKVTYHYSFTLNVLDTGKCNLSVITTGSNGEYYFETSEGSLKSHKESSFELVLTNNKNGSKIVKLDGKSFGFLDTNENYDDSFKWIIDDSNTKLTIKPRDGNSSYGFYELENHKNGHSMQKLYLDLYNACEEFIKSRTDVKDKNGLMKELSFDSYGLSTEEVISVYNVFCLENPAYYWLNNEVSINNNSLQVYIYPEYASITNREKVDNDINSMVVECSSLVKTAKNELEKALLIHDYVCRIVSYAKDNNGDLVEAQFVNSIVSAACKKFGLSEGYAKTFLYLCLKNNVECLIVSGYASEKHVWNQFKFNNKWYGVDCTWDDVNSGNLSYLCFGMSNSSTYKFRTANNSKKLGKDYLYELPNLSEKDIQLVNLVLNNKIIGLFENIDAAIQNMTDKNGNYIVDLYNYRIEGTQSKSEHSIGYEIYTKELPTVKSIAFNGNQLNNKNSSYEITYISTMNDLSVNSDLVLTNTCFAGTNSITVSKNTLCINSTEKMLFTTKLYANTVIVESEIEFRTNVDVGVFIAASKSNVTFSKNVVIDTLDVKNGEIKFIDNNNVSIFINQIVLQKPDFEIIFENTNNVNCQINEFNVVDGRIKTIPVKVLTNENLTSPIIRIDITNFPIEYIYEVRSQLSTNVKNSDTLKDLYNALLLKKGTIVLESDNFDIKKISSFTIKQSYIYRNETLAVFNQTFKDEMVDKILSYTNGKFIFNGVEIEDFEKLTQLYYHQ